MIILYRSDKPGTPGEISLKEERDDQNFSQDLLLNDQEMDQLDDDVQELMGAIAEAFLPKMNLSVWIVQSENIYSTFTDFTKGCCIKPYSIGIFWFPS